MNKFATLLILLLFFQSNIKITYSQVVINEFQASNASTIADIVDYEDYSDWIEIHNPTGGYIDIGGWYLTDNLEKPTKWQFPESYMMPGNSYLLIWADGYEENPNDDFNYLHTNFKLSKSGEEIGLFNSEGELVDKVIYGYQFMDISWGRKPDGGETWNYFGIPTPWQPNSTEGITEPIYTLETEFSVSGGFIETPISLELTSASESAVIRYTTNCSIPDSTSNIYTIPLTIDSTTVIRCRAFKTNYFPSQTTTHTYLFNESSNGLPTISLVATPQSLWDDNIGVYQNGLKGFEVTANFEYYDSSFNKQIDQLCDIRITGQASSYAPQKPFTISAKGKYGNDIFEYPFFSNRNYTNYKDLYLRNSGTPDAFYTMFRDGMTHSLVINETDIDCQAYRPTKVLLNGEYWGIYNIREKLNEDFLNNIHNVTSDNLNVLECQWGGNPIALSGNNHEYNFINDFLYENTLKQEENYRFVETKIDINSFIDYQIAEIFIDNVDWGTNNTKLWKENTYNSKWRFMLLDTDVSFGLLWGYILTGYDSYYYHNNLERATESRKVTLLFRSLLQNEEFKNEFIGRFATQLNTTFDSIRTLNIIDSLYNNIFDEMANHIDRWGNINHQYYGTPISSYEAWNYEVDIMREFARKRPDYQRLHILDYFKLSGMDSLVTIITEPEKGEIFINDIYITDKNKAGIYFHDVPIRIRAIPKLGYKFAGWNNNENLNPDTLLVIDSKTTITANFVVNDINILPKEISENTILTLSNSPYYSNGDITILAKNTLTIEAGVEILMSKDANIWVYGSLKINGTSSLPVTFSPNKTTGAENWGGICFEDGTANSILTHLIISDASNGNSLKHFSNISSYNTNLSLSNVESESNKQPFYSEYGEIQINACSFHSDIASDLINIKYATSALVENCTLIGNETVDADAIDYDNLTGGIIRNNQISGFIGYNSDGIDLGEQAINILIEDNYISRIADKGISIGQASTAIVKNNIIANCQQGIGIKDTGSFAEIDKNTFFQNDYAVACFEKNFGSGGGKATINNSILANSQESSLFVDQLSEIKTTYTLSNTEYIVGTGNIFQEPLFINDLAYNLELANESPCINSGDPNSVNDPDSSIIDMGAIYTYSNSNENSIIINEINYSSAIEYDSYDWIELFNTTDDIINLSGWSFFDEQNSHIFTLPDGITMAPKSYFVLCQNDSAFMNQYPTTTNYYGNFDFGLSNTDEIIRLFDSKMNLVNTVEYNSVAPWPTETKNTGFTLELTAENLDNSLPDNWRSSPYLKGSPGQTNNPETKAEFTYEIFSDCSGLIFLHNNTVGIYDSIVWDLGDGTSSKEDNLEHTFEESGTYTISLHAYSYFSDNTFRQTFNFYNIMPSPIAIGDTSCGSAILTLTNEENNEVLWYKNRFDIEPFHIGTEYLTPLTHSSKTYYISNEVDGCESDRIPITATVYNDAISYFAVDVENGLLTTTNKSANVLTYLWDFGDGTQSTEFEPTHQYTESGTYNLQLTAYNDYCGTTATSNRQIDVLYNSIEMLDIISKNEMIIYPNPTKGIINIATKTEAFEDITINIYNVYGQLLNQQNTNSVSNEFSTTMDLSTYKKGLYIIQLETDHKKITKRVVLN